MRNMVKLLIALLAMALPAAGTAEARAPQPMVLFKQKVKIGNNGGSLSGACGISSRPTPAPANRYSSFKGEAVVTRFEPGKPPRTVPFNDAVNKEKWLEVPGADSTDYLRVRPQKAEPGVEYEIDIRETTPAVPHGDESVEIKQFLDKFGANKPLVTKIDDLRKLYAELGDRTGKGLQDLVWDLEPGSEQPVTDVEKRIDALREKLRLLAAEPAVKAFLRDTAAVHEAITQSAVPELADHFRAQLEATTRAFVWGTPRDRERVSGRLKALSEQVERLTTDAGLKRFTTALRKFQETARAVPDEAAQEVLRNRARGLLTTYIGATPGERKWADERLVEFEKTAAWLSTDASAKEFFTRVPTVRDAIGKLPAAEVLGEDFLDELRDLREDFVFATDRDPVREDVTDLAERVAKLAGDDKLKRLAARRDELTKALDALPDSPFVDDVRYGFDSLIRGYVSPPFDKTQAENVRRRIDVLPESFAGLVADDVVKKFLTDADALEAKVRTALPFRGRPGAGAKHDATARSQFSIDLRATVEEFVLLNAAGRTAARDKFAALQADAKRLEAIAARREAYLKPTIASISPDTDGSPMLQIGDGEKVNLRKLVPAPGKPFVPPAGWVAHAGKPVLVDVTGLTDAEHLAAVEAVTAVRRRGLDVDFCFQRSPNGKANFKAMPEWEKVRVLGDSTSLKKLPSRVRTSLVDWLKELSAEWEGQKGPRIGPNRVQLIVDHFDKDGASLKALEGRVRNGDFRDTYVLALVCNSGRDSQTAFLKLADLAVKDGGAKMFCFPAEVMQAPIAPLVVESMIRLQRVPVASPDELPVRACKDVREKLERCAAVGDAVAVETALRREFPSRTGRNPADLFRNNDGEFKPDILKSMIDFLKSAERGFITISLTDELRPAARG